MASYSKQIQDLAAALALLDADQRKIVQDEVEAKLPRWTPVPGPQLDAMKSKADILFYGGSAGGGKSSLLIGLAMTHHKRAIIFRRESVQMESLIDEMTTVVGSRKGFNGQSMIWRLPGRQVEFGSCKDPDDIIKYQGRPHDLLAYDEVCLFTEFQFRFLQTWLRSTIEGQRCRVVCTGNPPTTAEGRWVINYWGPWLDPKHPNPALPGELRWYTTIDGKDTEVEDGKPFPHKGEILTPKSRTFIPSSVDDNPFLATTEYKSTLQGLPEPLRSQMLLGDFRAGVQDSEWQVIPTAWVDEAMARWKLDGKSGAMDSVGVDCSRGGSDKFSVSTRYGVWYDRLSVWPGAEVPDGPTGAGKVIGVLRDRAPLHVDALGVGSSVYDSLNAFAELQVVGIDSAAAAPEGSTDKTGIFKFRNMRAYLWWKFRESLDPVSGDKVALPPDPELKADLCAPLYSVTASGILVEPKDDKIGADGVRVSGIKRRLGRSPDKGESVIYCSMVTPKRTQKADMPEVIDRAKSYAVKHPPSRRMR